MHNGAKHTNKVVNKYNVIQPTAGINFAALAAREKVLFIMCACKCVRAPVDKQPSLPGNPRNRNKD